MVFIIVFEIKDETIRLFITFDKKFTVCQNPKIYQLFR